MAPKLNVYRHDTDPPPKKSQWCCNKKAATAIQCVNCKLFFHLTCANISSPQLEQMLDLSSAGVNIFWNCSKCAENISQTSLITVLSNTVQSLQSSIETIFTQHNHHDDKSSYSNIAKKNILEQGNHSFMSNTHIHTSGPKYQNTFNHSTTVIIPNIKEKNATKFSFVRAKISSQIPYVNLIDSRITHNKALLLFCDCEDTARNIVKLGEKISFFNGSMPMLYNEYIESNKNYKLFVRQINKHIDTNDILQEVSKTYNIENNKLKIIRMKKDNNNLNSILIVTKDLNLYNLLLSSGLKFGNIMYKVTKFTEKQIVRFCSMCLNYGHTSKFCLCEKRRCANCTLHHDEDVCKNAMLCLHCKKSDHVSGDQQCEQYKKYDDILHKYKNAD